MKKISILSAALLTVIAFTAIQSCKSSGKTSTPKLLKFNLEKGKGYDYDIVWDMDQKIMGQQSQISIAGIYALKVTDDSDHIKSLTSTYRSFKMNMKMMGMEIDIDTDKPSPPMSEEEIKKNPMGIMNRVFSGIIGKSFIMKVDEEGTVLEVDGFQEMLQGMADSMGVNEDMRNRITASLKDQFNEQTIKDQFAQIFTIFPNKEIRTGDSWVKNFAVGGKMPAKYSTTYTVKEIEGDHVTLATKTRIDSDGGDVEVNGTQTGEMIIDSKSGLMINGNFNQELDTKVQGMSMTISGKGKIKGKAN